MEVFSIIILCVCVCGLGIVFFVQYPFGIWGWSLWLELWELPAMAGLWDWIKIWRRRWRRRGSLTAFSISMLREWESPFALSSLNRRSSLPLPVQKQQLNNNRRGRDEECDWKNWAFTWKSARENSVFFIFAAKDTQETARSLMIHGFSVCKIYQNLLDLVTIQTINAINPSFLFLSYLFVSKSHEKRKNWIRFSEGKPKKPCLKSRKCHENTVSKHFLAQEQIRKR